MCLREIGIHGEGSLEMLDGLVASVDAKQAEAQAITKKVLLGSRRRIIEYPGAGFQK